MKNVLPNNSSIGFNKFVTYARPLKHPFNSHVLIALLSKRYMHVCFRENDTLFGFSFCQILLLNVTLLAFSFWETLFVWFDHMLSLVHALLVLFALFLNIEHELSQHTPLLFAYILSFGPFFFLNFFSED